MRITPYSVSIRRIGAAALTTAVAMAALAPGTGAAHATRRATTSGVIRAVAAENEYANVIQQIGGRYVSATGIMSNPTTDPHAYEASTTTATAVAGAQLVIQNGVGYDTFMNKLEAASPNRHRIVLTVASIVGAPANSPNPHLWYKPTTMPKVATAIANALSKLQPAHRAYFHARATAFARSLGAWTKAIARLKKACHGAPVAVTEPVADYLLQASALTIKTPWTFQASIMNGTDPSPQDVATEDALVSGKAKVLVYNQQAVTAETSPLIALATAHHVPVVGVYETMPPKMTYQTWMLAETNAIYLALKNRKSTVRP